MTDRELLELAAKAAYIGPLDFDYPQRECHGVYFGPRLPMPQGVFMAANWTYWNPLTDNGDALRLAVKLSLDVDIDRVDGVTLVTFGFATADRTTVSEEHGDNPYGATCRAIVRAAAEIGRAMP